MNEMRGEGCMDRQIIDADAGNCVCKMSPCIIIQLYEWRRDKYNSIGPSCRH